jgi:ABC-type anion transport system duplicated permease subunit
MRINSENFVTKTIIEYMNVHVVCGLACSIGIEIGIGIGTELSRHSILYSIARGSVGIIGTFFFPIVFKIYYTVSGCK